MKALGHWISERRPPAPMELDAWFPDEGGADALVDAALEALGRAEARPGRVREAAFDLLAADALLTYACEAALEGVDPESELTRILSAVVRGG